MSFCSRRFGSTRTALGCCCTLNGGLKLPFNWKTAPPEPREKGAPQGSVVSPPMANLFLHYAFDMWMRRNHPSIPFERYADDILCHCDSERQAQELKETLMKRFAECGLELLRTRRR
ncbi:reverse transcriptase domain-containing protein [Bradyrhizobium sp. USDA 4518]